MPETGTKTGFTIFRAADAPTLGEAGCMTVAPFSAMQRAGIGKMMAAGYGEGEEVRVLVDLPGFSITQVWFKKGFPLPLHSHDVDCLYHIVAGGLRLGKEDLGPRDSFFVPALMPYTYKPGPDGVELLEIRQQGRFNFVNHANGAAFWTKGAATCANNREEWKIVPRPARAE
jgi:hypothetical protein